jgi:amino acid transporter
LAILLVLPTNQITNLSGFIDAIKTVFTVYGGHVAKDGTVTLIGIGRVLGYIGAVTFIWALVTSGSTWIMGSDRIQAVAALDGAGPRLLGTFSARFGTPIVVNILSGIVSSVLMVLAFQLTSGDAGKYFSAVLGLVISTTTISYLAIFPALIQLRYAYPTLHRPYRVPGGMLGLWIVGLICEFWALFATIVLLWPGFLTAHPDASLPSGFTRGQYELTQFAPLAVLFVIGFLFYLAGIPTRGQIVRVALTPASDAGSTLAG